MKTFPILRINTAFTICIRADFIHTIQWRNIGRIGRAIFINRYQDAPIPVYENLYEIVKDKNYFVITTNVDHCFQKAGFDKQRLFYTQGDYGLFQCSVPCHNKTYDNEEIIRRMVAKQQDMKIPSELVPHCPVCGKPMTMNLRSDNTFVEDDGWFAAKRRYDTFLADNKRKQILFVEFGVGMNTPGIIKYPFWRMTYKNAGARYVCVNLNGAYASAEIAGRAVCLSEDAGGILTELSGEWMGKRSLLS